MLVPCGLVIAAGLLAIAIGHVYVGAVVLILARVAVRDHRRRSIAAQQSSDRIGAIAAYATWSDCGLAAGAFIGIVGMEWAGTATDLCARSAARRVAAVALAFMACRAADSAASARVTGRFCRSASRSSASTAARAAANERSMRVVR